VILRSLKIKSKQRKLTSREFLAADDHDDYSIDGSRHAYAHTKENSAPNLLTVLLETSHSNQNQMQFHLFKL
jgi:hypothetical protein